MKIVWLTGDYVDAHERQRQAQMARCNLVIEFHFNSADDPRAVGSEVWYKPDSESSESLARSLMGAYRDLGLPRHGDGVMPAVRGTRAAWIRHYAMDTVLLESLFVTNPNEARWIHNSENVEFLGRAIAGRVLAFVAPDATVGLSVGHLFKSSSPNDRGARCALGDTEGEHNQALANVVARLLVPSEMVGTHAEARSKTHLIVRGETLTSIGRNYGISVSALLQANPKITDKDMIIAGDTIVVPLPAGLPGPPPPAVGAPSPRPHQEGLPNTRSLGAREKFELYARYFAKHGLDVHSLRDGERAILGLRVTTGTHVNEEMGHYDDRMVVCWRRGGEPQVVELEANTEPCSFYEDTTEHRRRAPRKRRIEGRDANADGFVDLGCLPDGLYTYREDRNDALGGWVLRPTTDLYVVRDVNHDGVFDDADRKLVTIDEALNSFKTILFHRGGRRSTGSAGCMTMAPNAFSAFRESLGGQKTIKYALVTVE